MFVCSKISVCVVRVIKKLVSVLSESECREISKVSFGTVLYLLN